MDEDEEDDELEFVDSSEEQMRRSDVDEEIEALAREGAYNTAAADTVVAASSHSDDDGAHMLSEAF